ncbi:hypothetical protein F5Y12DRAFT_713214 [Xylaria sp. FL1777]|nr:hypothetical protein F5Y12DRAFT_713214 [Xylaria sp. FL1777]
MPISRKKACEQCRLAKARCSLDPVCVRCLNRGLECKYSGGSFRIGPYTRPHLIGVDQSPSSAGPVNTAEPLSRLFSLSDLGVTSLEYEGAIGEDPALGNSEIDHWVSFQANEPLLSREVPEDEAPDDDPFLTFPLRWDMMGESQLEKSQPNIHSAAPMGHSVEAAVAAECLPQSDRPSLPRGEDERSVDMDESTVAIHVKRYKHLLAHRRGMTNELPLMARTLTGQIQNYPTMLIRGSRLPPFIYPQCVLNNRLSHHCTATTGMHQCFPEPLANCAALTQMFYSRISGNTQFIWKAIYDEQKRLYDEYRTYDIPTLLAAAQAVVVYILIQAQDTESIAKNDVASLAVTFSDMLARLSFGRRFEKDIYKDPSLSQESWAVYEGIRRTISLLYVIRIVLGIQIGNPGRCCAILATPLPAGRALWDQDATETWAIRLDRYKSRIVSHKVLTIDDLLCYSGTGQAGKNGEENTLIQKDLVTWCESLDEFGTLVWMASLLDR